MLSWVSNSIAGVWFAWNYWSIVPVIVFVVLSILAYKRITAPEGIGLSQNYRDNRKEQAMSIPKMKRIVNLLLISGILVMGGILFTISLFKMS